MPDIKYVGALPLIILNMWPSINCSTLYSIGSSPTCFNSLPPTWNLHNGVARIFVWGATRPMPRGIFCVISGSRPDSVGGGVEAEYFRDLHKQTRFAGGGG